MKLIDVRFSADNLAILKAMAGKKMLKYKCDPFVFSTAVYGIVGLNFEGDSLALTNLTEVMDYFGNDEDVALFKMKRMPFDRIKSMVQNQDMIETPVRAVIKEISVINECQRLFEKDVQIYEIWLTRGIIFKFEDGHELSLEKNIWFSEDISVEKGYNLLERFSPTEEFEKSWSGNYRGECSREIIKLTS